MWGSEVYALEPLYDLDEQSEFLNILYHSAKGGAGIRLILQEQDGETVARHFGSRKLGALEYRSSVGDVYVTVNTFKSHKRKVENLYNYSGIYIDLDGHSFKPVEAMDRAIERTRNRLAKAFKKGEISAPTMICHTGRGLGIYYILKSSIANCPNAKKSIQFLEQVRAALTARYKRLLDGRGYLEVDGTVKDAARVCRLPLTINHHINRWCRLIHIERDDEGEVVYYDLKELAKKNHLFDQINEIRNKLRKDKIVGIDEYKMPFLTIRLQKLEMLQELRRYDCQGVREYMTFIYYNAATQLYGADRAVEAVQQFNERFKTPLPAGELMRTIQGVDRNEAPLTHDYEGFYKLPDAWIMDVLDVTTEENRKCLFGASRKQIDRQRTKEANQRKRQERNEEIASYIKEHPEATYPEIAKIFLVSEGTIYNICKEYGIKRYKKTPVIIKEEATQLAEKQDQEAVAEASAKSEKFASEYQVFLLGSGSSVISRRDVSSVGKQDGLVQAYMDLYGQVTRQRRRMKQVSGQLGFRWDSDGAVEYYMIS